MSWLSEWSLRTEPFSGQICRCPVEERIDTSPMNAGNANKAIATDPLPAVAPHCHRMTLRYPHWTVCLATLAAYCTNRSAWAHDADTFTSKHRSRQAGFPVPPLGKGPTFPSQPCAQLSPRFMVAWSPLPFVSFSFILNCSLHNPLVNPRICFTSSVSTRSIGSAHSIQTSTDLLSSSNWLSAPTSSLPRFLASHSSWITTNISQETPTSLLALTTPKELLGLY